MAADINKDLKVHGWHLSQDGVDICKDEIKPNMHLKWSDVSKVALDFDLGDIGEKVLPDDFGKEKLGELNGPCVLQVVRVRNVSAPKANEQSSGSPRMLQIHLTDGHKTCVAIEHEKIGSLRLDMAPGTKICLKGKMPVHHGTVLLKSQNVDMLGGRVDSLYSKWAAAKEASGFSRNIGALDDTPPPFVSFGKKITYKYKSSTPSLEKADQTGEESKEFNEQRQAAIAEVQKNKADSSGKVFSSGPNMTNMPAKTSYQQQRSDRPGNDIYRDVQASHNKNAKADEKLCDQLAQMGFARHLAANALQRCGNNLEEALEHLVSSGDSKTASAPAGRGRNDRGGRGGRRGGRGRNSRYDRSGEEGEQRQSSSTTLFDFLETKMANPAQSKKNVVAQSSDRAVPSRRTDADDEADRIQDEYLMEYVRELSLVETRGGGSDGEQKRTQNARDATQGQPKGRGRAGDRYEKPHGMPTSGYDRPGTSKQVPETGRAPPERRNHSGGGAPRSYDQQIPDNRTNGVREEEGRHSRSASDQSGGQKRGKSYKNARGNRLEGEPTPSGLWADAEPPRIEQERLGPESSSSGWPGGQAGTNHQQQQRGFNYDRQSDIPPRFRKNQQQQYPSADAPSNRPKYNDREMYNAPRTQERPKASYLEKKKGLTLADTARQIKSAEPQPPQQPDQQRPRNANRGPRTNHVWRKGMSCRAKYWEDGQFYEAVVEDVHNELPFAVVRFHGYDNCEEVAFDDMAPAVAQQSKGDRSENRHSVDHIYSREFRRRRDPNVATQARQPRPTQPFYQFPARKQPS